MAISKDFLLKALLQYNYLPNQRETPEEMPPLFSSGSFTESVARKLRSPNILGVRKGSGYDSVEYRLTRFDGVTRSCSIPHPVAYANLALSLHENWDELSHIADNEVSMLRPQEHTDGRIGVMDYGNRVREHQATVNRSFGKRFVVHTDISNFFPGIYSHAIPWAIVGLAEAKRNSNQRGLWYNKLDQAVRMTKRNETQGVAIGPATSNIISELILARVDTEMKREGFTFFRHIDDYIAFCETHEEAQKFISSLSAELAKFKLLPNVGKTKILGMPRQFIPDWLLSLVTALPEKDSEVSPYSVITYLNLAVSLAEKSPEGSVLKYALKAVKGSAKEEVDNFNSVDFVTAHDDICRMFQESSVKAILDYAMSLAFHQPVLAPLLADMLEAAYLCQAEFRYGQQISALLAEYSRLRYSDATAWALYYAISYNVPIGKTAAEGIIETRDCVPILLLYLSDDPACVQLVVNFADQLDKEDLYELDSFWLLLYQLFKDGKIAAPYQNDRAFKVMKDNGVSFIDADLLERLRIRREMKFDGFG